MLNCFKIKLPKCNPFEFRSREKPDVQQFTVVKWFCNHPKSTDSVTEIVALCYYATPN